MCTFRRLIMMFTSRFHKFNRRLSMIGIVSLVVLLVLIGLFISPLSPFHMCTLIGCRDTLELTLSHEPTSPYTALFTSATGETRTFTCTPNQISAADDLSIFCRLGTITIYGFTPSYVSIEINWLNERYSASVQPSYEILRPNGLFCPPSCRVGKIRIELP
jgi:hypothetical protein